MEEARWLQIVSWACVDDSKSKSSACDFDRSLPSTAEVTLHLHQKSQKKGYGRTLLNAMIEKSRDNGLKNLIAGISGDNTGSLAFFKKMGFRTIGIFEGVGWRNETWLDLVQMQFRL